MENFNDPSAALNALANSLQLVGEERTSPVVGRVLARSVLADRDSPAANVSAMDGYAVRLADLRQTRVPISGEVQPGESPPTLEPGTAMRVFTGAVVPLGAEAVVMREDTDESSRDFIAWQLQNKTIQCGANIRFQGENGLAGSCVLSSGSLLTPASIAATANFGVAETSFFRAVRVTIIVTGNELLDVHDSPLPWQIRDSNGPTIAAACQKYPWIKIVSVRRCHDDAIVIQQTIGESLSSSDAVILTGGVSKGDYDHVPGVITRLGAKTVFHRLPIRPGRPILGAVSEHGQLILGLPGNPVSAIVGMTYFGIPLLAKQSGQSQWQPTASTMVTVTGSIDKSLPLHWFRLVRLTTPSLAETLESRGSGDLVALSNSSGFVHQPPNETGSGPWPYYAW